MSRSGDAGDDLDNDSSRFDAFSSSSQSSVGHPEGDLEGNEGDSETIHTFSPRSVATEEPQKLEDLETMVLPAPALHVASVALPVMPQRIPRSQTRYLTSEYWITLLGSRENFHLPDLSKMKRLKLTGESRVELYAQLEAHYAAKVKENGLLSLFVSYMKGKEYRYLGFSLQSHQGTLDPAKWGVLESQFPSHVSGRLGRVHEEQAAPYQKASFCV